MNETFNIRTFVKQEGRTHSELLMKGSNPDFTYSPLERLEILMAKPELLYGDLLKSKDACDYIGVTRNHLYRLCRNNKIRAYKDAGGRLSFKKDDLNHWVESNRPTGNFELNVFTLKFLQEIERR